MSTQLLLGVAIWLLASVVLGPLVGSLIRGAERLADRAQPNQPTEPEAPGNHPAAA